MTETAISVCMHVYVCVRRLHIREALTEHLIGRNASNMFFNHVDEPAQFDIKCDKNMIF